MADGVPYPPYINPGYIGRTSLRHPPSILFCILHLVYCTTNHFTQVIDKVGSH